MNSREYDKSHEVNHENGRCEEVDLERDSNQSEQHEQPIDIDNPPYAGGGYTGGDWDFCSDCGGVWHPKGAHIK